MNNSTESIYDLSRYPVWLLSLRATNGILLSIVGVIVNTLTIAVLLRSPHLRNAASYFIVSLSVADLIYSGVVLPITASRYLGGMWVTSKVWCTVVPLSVYGNVAVSLMSVVMITVNRYVKIVHYNAYTRIYKRLNIAVMIAFCWTFSYVMQLPTLFGVWGQFGYDEKARKCDIIPDSGNHSSKDAFFILGFVIPCLTVVFCYTRILYVVFKSDQRMVQHAESFNVEVKRKRMELRKTKMVFIIFVTIIGCFLPITIIKITDKHLKYPGLHVAGHFLVNLSACVNPVIYVIMNQLYRQAFINLLRTVRSMLCRVICGKSDTLDVTQMNNMQSQNIEEDRSQYTSDISVRSAQNETNFTS